jgi:O-acetylserine/cysteine efflux transporter
MRPAHIALAVLVAAVWGFNFVAIKVGLRDVPPILFSGLRFFLAALPLLVLGVRGGPPVPWRFILAIGVVLGVVKFTLLFIGMDMGMPAGLSSLVLQAQAFFTVVFAAIALGERPRLRQVMGMAVAFAGIAAIAWDMPTGGSVTGLVLVVAAAAAWGVANILLKAARAPDLFRLMLWVSVVPPLPLFALSLLLEGPDRVVGALTGLTPLGGAALVYVAGASTLFGFAAWGFLLRSYPVAVVAPFSLLVPVFGMSSSSLLLGEDFTPARLAGAALVLAGLALIVGMPAALRPAGPRAVSRGPENRSAPAHPGPEPVPPAQARADGGLFDDRILILVPHPDDEVVGCAAAIARARARGARVFALYLTTGVPGVHRTWRPDPHRHAGRVRHRQAEALEAAAALGIEPVGFLPHDSQTLKSHLNEVRETVRRAIADSGAGTLWVPAYEGGHQDHDAASALAWTLRDEVTVWEFAEYNNAGTRTNSQCFPLARGNELEIRLSQAEAAAKTAALALYSSERRNLGYVRTDREMFRPHAGYDYSRPPHEGTTFYARFQWVPFRHPRIDFTRPAEVSAAIGGFLTGVATTAATAAPSARGTMPRPDGP